MLSLYIFICMIAQSAGAVENTDYRWVILTNECPRDDTKQSYGEAPVIEPVYLC